MDAVHPRVLGYLGRALSLELTAVQQFMTQACLADVWGDTEAAHRFREETVEEMRHAEAIVQRMVSLAVAPAASQLRPVGHDSTLVGLLRLDLDLEDQLVNLYAEAVSFCLLSGDEEHERFFRQLWSDEQHHREELAAWLAAVARYRAELPERATF
ncbi:MAG: ferritin-like domain-containing protein [Cyanobium sp.]|nr:ferritin-like domain-containing protein [Cyanobium sp.]